MKIDFRLPREWATANEKVAAALGNPVGAEIYTFQNIHAALVETVFGLSQLHPHKKKAFYFKNMNPLFEAAVMPLAKMGYIVTALDLAVLADPAPFVATLDREALLVLFAADDPLLGRRYDTKKLSDALSEKPVAQVRVSHNAHFYDGLTAALPRTAVHLYSLQPKGAVAMVGDRSRFGVLTADQIPQVAQVEKALAWAKTQRSSTEDLVKNFEAKNIGDSRPVLKDARVYDRAIIAWSDMDGHAVIARLAERLKITLGEPGSETRLETTSLSRWGGVRTMDFLRAQGLSPETIRGLVMIAADMLSLELEKHLSEVRRELLAEQFAGAPWVNPSV